VQHERLLCCHCLVPVGLAEEHVRDVAPDLHESDELRSALLEASEEAQGLCMEVAGSCPGCDARFCSRCVARDALATHALPCAGVSALRDRWSKLAASPRFRLFVQGVGLVSQAGSGRTAAVAAAIETLCRPALPSDDNTLASAVWETELAEPLALLHCALVRERLERAAQEETAMETSAAITRITQWCTPRFYRSFERRIATNAHGLRFTSPAGTVLAAAVAACPTLSAETQDTVFWAVAGVGEECRLPFYCASAVFATASALNHSCNPSAEVVSCGRAELQLRTTRAVRAGEELSIAYISRSDRAMHSVQGEGAGATIRAELEERYGFVCTCEICVKEEVCKDQSTT
jgi:hypothetical protein